MAPAGTQALYGDELLLTREEFAFLAQMKLRTVKYWVDNGKLKVVRISGVTLIPASQLCLVSQ